ncbi:MAG: universal stress protein UspA related nucleotide-binding protein [uncultured archaeon A07HB70]|nr:MAG: universal stress protein UspA related nucleotide-binding protein [uncultured archaeon A07HB70]
MNCGAGHRGAITVDYDTVLVPTDGSDEVDRALGHALRIAVDHDAALHALYVVDGRILRAAGEDRESVATDLRRRGEGAVAAVADRVGAAGVETVTAVREGTPDVAIRDYAADVDADVVVMAPHGRTGRERLRSLGSVTERVVTDAERPVFVVGAERES